jgi:hypothetical protein
MLMLLIVDLLLPSRFRTGCWTSLSFGEGMRVRSMRKEQNVQVSDTTEAQSLANVGFIKIKALIDRIY